MTKFNLANFSRFVLLLLSLGLVPTVSKASTAWPGLMNYQGRLTDNTGNAVSDGPYIVTFRIYDQASGGSLKWAETQTVTVTKGLFNVVLGSLIPLTSIPLSNYTADLWVGVTVGGDSEMTPRQQLLPAVYAKSAQSLAGLLPNNTANNLVVLNGSGKLPAGVLDSSGFSLPLSLQAADSGALLAVSNTGSAPSALGISALGPNGILSQAADSAGYGIWAQTAASDSAASVGLRANSTLGIGILAQTVGGVGLSVTSQSSLSPALFVGGDYPLRLIANSGVTGNIGLQATSSGGAYSVNLLDRSNRAGLFANITSAGAFGVSATASAGTGVYGQTNSNAATDYGVFGLNNGTSGVGVYGQNNSSGAGAGVQGQGFVGVQGLASQNNGSAIQGDVPSTVSGAIAVLGQNSNSTGVGVIGRHLGTGGGMGVRGASASGVGALGVFGTVSGTGSIGVEGFSSSSTGYGMRGIQNSSAPAANVAGVFGRSKDLATGIGVRGEGSQGVYGLSNGNCGVCAYNNNSSGGYGVYANSPVNAILAESTSTSSLAYGIYASIQSTASNSAAGYFLAQGSSGANYAVFASNSSPAGQAVHAVAAAGGTNYFSDNQSGQAYGFYHSDAGSSAAGGVGIYAAENCDNCFGGIFINNGATSGVGGALWVQGRIRIQDSAGTFVAGSGASSFTLNNSYITPSCLIFLTVASSTSSVAAVTSKSTGSANITFTPALAANTTYQFMIVGQ